MAAPSTDLSSPSIAGSVSLLDQSTATSIYWPWSSNDGARSSHDTSFHLLRLPRSFWLAVLAVIRYSQVPKAAAPRKVSILRLAVHRASCTTSSASDALPVM